MSIPAARNSDFKLKKLAKKVVKILDIFEKRV